MNTKRKSCFISAPVDADLSVIKAALNERNINVVTLDQISLLGYNMIEQIATTISNVDFVVAILSSPPLSHNIYFELGVAHGLNKQILIIADPTIQLPPDLSGVFNIRTNVNNTEAIVFAIDQLVEAPNKKSRRTIYPVQKSKPIGAKSKALLQQIKQKNENISELEIIQIVLTAIQASDISIFAEAQARNIGADVALWADDLIPTFTNPFLIEVQKRIVSRMQADVVSNQVQKYLLKNNANGILLLYLKAKQSLIDGLCAAHPGILAMSIEEFLSKLEKESFSEVVHSARNSKMHKGSI